MKACGNAVANDRNAKIKFFFGNGQRRGNAEHTAHTRKLDDIHAKPALECLTRNRRAEIMIGRAGRRGPGPGPR